MSGAFADKTPEICQDRIIEISGLAPAAIESDVTTPEMSVATRDPVGVHLLRHPPRP
jgi:hypothetical protein